MINRRSDRIIEHPARRIGSLLRVLKVLVVVAAQQAAKGIGRIRLTRGLRFGQEPRAGDHRRHRGWQPGTDGRLAGVADWTGWGIGVRSSAPAPRSVRTYCRWPTGWRRC